ncbi:marginal zone B- and B1-cell-specific protein-like [Mytilus trossulus]|uniref:marginal zone B- and B1-cell-specific protein-like n=1 Tax=Mytilus trossulus TaxID=6551 RepID=UPI003006FCFA
MDWCIIRDFILTLSLWNVCTGTDFAGASVDEAEDGKQGVINFSTPSLSDEEAHSIHMPAGLKCDGCLVVAYQLASGFSKAERGKSKRLTESQIFDVTDTVCGRKGFDQYGVKEIKGKKQLSGPGMPANESPGIMQGGGKWPTRLQAMCSNYIGELGEEEVYDAYREDETLVNTLCYDKGMFGLCSGQNKKDEL